MLDYVQILYKRKENRKKIIFSFVILRVKRTYFNMCLSGHHQCGLMISPSPHSQRRSGMISAVWCWTSLSEACGLLKETHFMRTGRRAWAPWLHTHMENTRWCSSERAVDNSRRYGDNGVALGCSSGYCWVTEELFYITGKNERTVKAESWEKSSLWEPLQKRPDYTVRLRCLFPHWYFLVQHWLHFIFNSYSSTQLVHLQKDIFWVQ